MRKNEDYAVETLKQSHFICLIAAAAALSACSSAGEALGDALTPSPAPKGHYRTLKIEASQSNTLLPDADSSITITDSEKQGAERTKTYRSGDGFDMGNKLLDRITELEYERKDGSGKVFDRGKLVLYRQDYSAVVGLIPSYVAANGSGLESGKLHIAGAQGEHTRAADIPLASDHFRYFASVIRGEEGTATQLDSEDLSIVLREPIGVVGQIIPWNFPFLMAAWKIAPALAAGCTIVIHPSSSTSLSLLSFAQKINHLLPKGVLNIITGRGSKSGEYMLHHKGFNKLAFTGSTEIGRHIGIAAAEMLIPATLELGGKSANIFFDDMPFDKALEGAQKGILFNQGQVCCAGSRIFVQEGIYDKFVNALAEEFKKIKVGLPWEDDTQMGSQVNAGQLETILKYVKIGEQEGCRIITGGKKIEGELGKGEFVEPTLIEADSNNARVAQEEIFGPVATVIKFKTEEEVIKMANDSEYGLGGAVWSTDINRCLRVSNALETGRVWVNCYNRLPAGAPFGGYKTSGIGRETHKMMLAAYTQVKNIYISTREEREGFY